MIRIFKLNIEYYKLHNLFDKQKSRFMRKDKIKSLNNYLKA